MNIFSKLISLCDRLLQALENIAKAINNSVERNRVQSEIPNRISAEIRFPSEVAEAKDAVQWEQIGIQRRTSWWTLLGVIAAVVYAGISCCQWKEMRNQTINSARAWVGLDGVIMISSFDVASNPQVKAKYTIKNFGNGPAFNVYAWALPFYDADQFQANTNNICGATTAMTMRTLPSTDNRPHPAGYALFRDQAHIEFIDAPWTNIPNPPKIQHVWFLGCVSYRDQFNKPHWTRFCQHSDSAVTDPNEGTALYLCSLYNDTDDK